MTHRMETNLKIESAGKVIQARRKEAGLALEALADRLGWEDGKGRLSKYENDRLGLSLPVIEEIARALGKRAEPIVLECLKARYPALASERSTAGRLLNQLV